MDMFRESGCDAISVARGSFGQPWIFNDIYRFLQGQKVEPKTLQEIKAIAQEHFDLLCEHFEWRFVIPKIYKHLTWYFKKCKNMHEHIQTVKTRVTKPEDFSAFVEEFA